ncbi:MAG: SagB/ThcOx family dehydrogenase [Candidatus Cloacimonetes bacterium]|nr:SagB/ThcOx family dehydrogenase [Candidatus Cloacimonadota bacterium]
MKYNSYVKLSLAVLITILILLPLWLACAKPAETSGNQPPGITIPLPEPMITGSVSVEQAIHQRRSTRSFKDESLSIAQISQILYSAQGISHQERGLRTAPSAGAIYPLELYAIIGKADDIDPGLYRYQPTTHSLALIQTGDLRQSIISKVSRQAFVASAPISLILTVAYERISERYSERGMMYAHMEVGHVGQNVHLQAEALGLGTVMVGAFNESELAKQMALPDGEIPLYIMPVGKK